MLTIYLVRHGETLFNMQHKIQGWCDSPLTEKGIAQAKRLHDALMSTDFVHAYCSTSERCIDTANFILEGRNITLTPAKTFKELNFGTLEGDSEDLLQKLSNPMERYERGFRENGGESMQDVKDRMLAGLDMIAKQHEDGNVLLVSHGGSIMNLVDVLAPDLMRTRPSVSNCSVTKITYDQVFKIISFNQVF